MEKRIKEYFEFLLQNYPEFVKFKKEHEHLSDEEIAKKFNFKIKRTD